MTECRSTVRALGDDSRQRAVEYGSGARAWKPRSSLAHSNSEEDPTAPPSPLAGKVFDEQSEPLYVQGAAKGHRRYRYYVSRELVRGEVTEDKEGWRLAALELERTVMSAAKAMLDDHAAIADTVDENWDRHQCVTRSAEDRSSLD